MAASRIATFPRIGVLLSLCALLLILTLENWLNQPLSISRWLIQTIPLLAFLPGLISNKLRAYQWLCFVILLYFISGVLNIFTPEKLISGIMLTLFCVLLFCFAIFYVRDEQKNKSA